MVHVINIAMCHVSDNDNFMCLLVASKIRRRGLPGVCLLRFVDIIDVMCMILFGSFVKRLYLCIYMGMCIYTCGS